MTLDTDAAASVAALGSWWLADSNGRPEKGRPEVQRSFDWLPTAATQPLGLGTVVRVATGGALDTDLLVHQVRSALDAADPTTLRTS